MPPLIVLSDTEEKEVCERYKNGDSLATISRRFGFSVVVIKRALDKHGIETRSRQGIKGTNNYKTAFNDETIDCNTQGRRCIFRSRICDFRCDYMGKTGELRGGSPHECTKYVLK